MTAPPIARLVEFADHSLRRQLQQQAPFMGRKIFEWIEEMFAGSSLAEVFTRPNAFPVLQLPWWLEELISPPDESLHRDLVSSTVCGYLYIRLIDNVMDADAPGDPRLLPALSFLATGFVRPYVKWFPHPHPFWPGFKGIWVGAADATLHDSFLPDLDQRAFREVAARKTHATKIPLLAVCHLHGRLDRFEPWGEFVDSFSRWHQFLNDLHGWVRDLERGAATYLLSEAERRRRSGESVAAWMLREGVDWALVTLNGWMEEVQALAASLGSPGLLDYLEQRTRLQGAKEEAARAGMEAARRLAQVVDSGGPAPAPAGRRAGDR